MRKALDRPAKYVKSVETEVVSEMDHKPGTLLFHSFPYIIFIFPIHLQMTQTTSSNQTGAIIITTNHPTHGEKKTAIPTKDQTDGQTIGKKMTQIPTNNLVDGKTTNRSTTTNKAKHTIHTRATRGTTNVR